jgi:arabinofuranosyltransferase
LLAYALTAGLLTIFRVWYFGYPLPNTYYAKISPSLTYRMSQGSQYLWAYLSSGPVPLTCSLAAVFSIFHVLRVRLQDMRSGALGLMAMAGLMLPVYLGGDHFGGFRFYQPIYPILLLTLVHSLRFIAPQYVAPGSGRSAGRALTIAAVALGGWFLVTRIADWRNFDREAVLRREFTIAELGRDRGRHADALFAGLESRPSIGTITVGGLKYAYSGEVIDLMGLNNTRMAHNNGTRVGIRSHAAFETRTFYELHPTLLLPLVQYSELAVQATRIWFVDVALKGLVDEKPFRDKYRLAEVRRATPAGTVGIAGWYDRDFLSQLARSKEFQIIESQERPE